MKKKITLFMISLVLILSLSACGEKSITGITNFDVKDISKEAAEEEIDQTKEVDNSRTVYVTPYGSKYHYRSSCAGSNATATTENSASGIYDPCKKCAQ